MAALAREIKPYKDDNHILVYCGATKIAEQDENGEDMRQIDAITELLGKGLKIFIGFAVYKNYFKHLKISFIAICISKFTYY